MKVVILGNTGMLGHVVQDIFKKDSSFTVEGFGRESLELFPRTLNQMGTKLSSLLGFDTDYVVNCMGATKPFFDATTDLSTPLYVNAIFPHQLAKWGELSNTRIIHVTTDCVYDGHIGRYDERCPHSAPDHYGKSKSLGEPDNCMVVRTSIIGPEFGDRRRHFLSWVKSMAGLETKGFTNHFWNGVTTVELARILALIIKDGLYDNGASHIHSSDISKFDMVKQISDVYGLDINVAEHETKHDCDRRLRSVKDLNFKVQTRPYHVMISEMFDYEKHNA